MTVRKILNPKLLVVAALFLFEFRCRWLNVGHFANRALYFGCAGQHLALQPLPLEYPCDCVWGNIACVLKQCGLYLVPVHNIVYLSLAVSDWCSFFFQCRYHGSSNIPICTPVGVLVFEWGVLAHCYLKTGEGKIALGANKDSYLFWVHISFWNIQLYNICPLCCHSNLEIWNWQKTIKL